MISRQQIVQNLIEEAKSLEGVYSVLDGAPNLWNEEITEKLNRWYSNADSVFNTQYENHPFYDDFVDCFVPAITLKKKIAFDRMVSILKIIDNVHDDPWGNYLQLSGSNDKKDVEQNQEQEPTPANFDMFIDAIKDDLTGRQQKELKSIMLSEGEPQQKLSMINDKLKSFGFDILSNILANIVANPAVYTCLG